MKKVLIFVLLLFTLLIFSCDGTVDEKLFGNKEFKITYLPGSGDGNKQVYKTENFYHELLPNSALELNLTKSYQTKGLTKAASDSGYTGYRKKDFSFYGWRDQDGNYYHYSLNKEKNKYKFTKDTVLEAMWRNDLTGELISQQEYDTIEITAYSGTGESLILPRVYTDWSDPDNPKEYLVTSIAEGAVSSDNLKSVVIPDTVETIKENAFSSCTNLKAVEIKSETPPEIGNNAFPSEVIVVVPTESVDDYIASLPGFTVKEEHTHNKNKLIQDNEDGHHWECTECGYNTEVEAHTYGSDNYCTVCGYFKSSAEGGSSEGGFNIQIVVKEPVGHIEYSYSEETGKWTFWIKDESNALYPINKWTWYLFGEEKSNSSTYELSTPNTADYEIYCEFENVNGVGDSTVVIKGRAK